MKNFFTLVLILSTISGFAQKSDIQIKREFGTSYVVKDSEYEMLFPGATGETQVAWIDYWFSPAIGFVFGTNTDGDLAYGQHFVVEEPYQIIGGKFWFGSKEGTQGNVIFKVWNMTANGPGNVLYEETVPFADINGSLNLNDAFEIIFETPVTVLSDYVIGIDISGLNTYTHSTGDDDTGEVTYGLSNISSQAGQGGQNWLAWVQFDDGVWYNTQVYGENGFDVDIAIFPYAMPASHMVTFRVNMAPAVVDGFDPAVHNVFVTGNFLDPEWPIPGTEGSVELTLEADTKDLDIFWEEGFENWDTGNPGFLPEGWSVYRTANLADNPTDVPETKIWVANNPDSNPFGGGENPNPDAWKTYVNTGEGSIIIGFDAPEFTWAVTPEIILPEDVGNLEFWTWYVNAGDAGTYPTNYHVSVFADGVWNVELSQIGANSPETNNIWEAPVTIDLSDYSEKTIKVAFIYEYVDGYEMAIDDIVIYGTQWVDPDAVFYSATLEVATGDIEYKYFSNAFGEGWAGAEWEGGDNRSATIRSDVTLNSVWGVVDPVSVSNVLAESGINLYPNPVRNTLYVENSAQINEVRIFDLTGRLVMSQQVNGNVTSVNVSEFNQGVYVMQVISVNGVASQKFNVIK